MSFHTRMTFFCGKTFWIMFTLLFSMQWKWMVTRGLQAPKAAQKYLIAILKVFLLFTEDLALTIQHSAFIFIVWKIAAWMKLWKTCKRWWNFHFCLNHPFNDFLYHSLNSWMKSLDRHSHADTHSHRDKCIYLAGLRMVAQWLIFSFYWPPG